MGLLQYQTKHDGSIFYFFSTSNVCNFFLNVLSRPQICFKNKLISINNYECGLHKFCYLDSEYYLFRLIFLCHPPTTYLLPVVVSVVMVPRTQAHILARNNCLLGCKDA